MAPKQSNFHFYSADTTCKGTTSCTAGTVIGENTFYQYATWSTDKTAMAGTLQYAGTGLPYTSQKATWNSGAPGSAQTYVRRPVARLWRPIFKFLCIPRSRLGELATSILPIQSTDLACRVCSRLCSASTALGPQIWRNLAWHDPSNTGSVHLFPPVRWNQTAEWKNLLWLHFHYGTLSPQHAFVPFIGQQPAVERRASCTVLFLSSDCLTADHELSASREPTIACSDTKKICVCLWFIFVSRVYTMHSCMLTCWTWSLNSFHTCALRMAQD